MGVVHYHFRLASAGRVAKGCRRNRHQRRGPVCVKYDGSLYCPFAFLLHRSHNQSLVVSGDDFSLVKIFKYPSYVEHSESRAHIAHASHVTNVAFTQ